MGKFAKELLWRVSFVVIGTLLGPFVYNIIGQQYPDLINRQPKWLLITILLSVLALSLLLFVLHRRRVVHKSNLDRDVSDFDISPEGDESFALLKYKGVGWEVVFPKPLISFDPFGERDLKKHLLNLDLDRVRVDYFPFCPECCSRLKEHDTFVGLNLWECKKCGYKKRSFRDLNYERKRATIKAREEFGNLKNGKRSETMVLLNEYEDLFTKTS